MKGAGTSTSPFSIESDSDEDIDSEDAVTQQLIQVSRASSEAASSPPQHPGGNVNGKSPEQDPDIMEIDGPSLPRNNQNNQTVQHKNDIAEHGGKRKRSASVMSHGSVDQHKPQASSSTLPPHPPGESRKARKRRRKAERDNEVYLERWRNLQNAPGLTPNFDLFPGITAAMVAAAGPFPFLPQLHANLVNQDFPIPGYTHPNNQQQHGAWGPVNAMCSHLVIPHHEGGHKSPLWDLQPAMTPFDAQMQSTSTPFTDPELLSATVGGHPLPTKPVEALPEPVPIQPIGVEPDQDRNSKHGVFKISPNEFDKDKRQYIPTPACTLVLEQLPKSHRNADFVNSWARKASGTHPARVLVDQTGAKALVEFPSADAARTAWGSPRLGAANIGLKPHLLKGRPRDDLIKAHWYRVDGVSDGVGEIEEGEIQEAGENVVDRKETKKEKKARMAKQREEKQQRNQDLARQRELAAAPLNTPLSPGVSIPPQAPWPASTSSAPLAHGLPLRPNHLPPSVPPLPNGKAVHAAPNGQRLQMRIQTTNMVTGDEDMDLSSPSPTMGSPLDAVINSQQPPTPALSRSAQPFVPSLPPHRPIPSAPRAMQAAPTAPTPQTRQLAAAIPQPPTTAPPALPPSSPPSESSNANHAIEASLRELVLKSRLNKNKQRQSPPSSSTTTTTPLPTEKVGPSVTTAPAPSFEPPPSSKTTTPLPAGKVGPSVTTAPATGFDAIVNSFIADAVGGSQAPVPRPPPPPRALSVSQMQIKAELASKQQQLEEDIAERKRLMDQLGKTKTKAEKDAILSLLRDKDKAQDAAQGQGMEPVKPSAKINLDYVPPPKTPFGGMEEADTVIILSDDEDED